MMVNEELKAAAIREPRRGDVWRGRFCDFRLSDLDSDGATLDAIGSDLGQIKLAHIGFAVFIANSELVERGPQ